jgi:putative phosphoribosyl transferase
MRALLRQSQHGAMIFPNRAEAGRTLAQRLQSYAKTPDVVVLGIPRGGVPVAFEVAAALKAPLDVFILRKLGVPYQEELAFGAIASGGIRYIDKEIVEAAGIPDSEIERVVAKQTQELERRERVYRGGRPPLDVRGKTVILVDDGIATGASMQAAITALRKMEPGRLVAAVPVAPASTCKRLARMVDELICVHMPESFYAIGEFYEDFSQLTDEEVTTFLHRPVTSPAQNVS